MQKHIESDAQQMILAKAVRAARNQLGWTQEKLAEEADIDVRTVIKIEQGKGNPMFNSLYSLIRALRLDARQLFYHEQFSSAPTAAHLQEFVSTLSEDEAQKVMSIVQIVVSAMRGEKGYDLIKR